VQTREISAEKFAQMIISSGTIGIAYTYSEPYIWFETIMDVGKIVREAGLKNVMVTNGYMEPEPLAELLKVVDAMNVDIKSMNPKFYKELCKAELAPVLRTCETVKKNAHLEITNLVIPGENDIDEEFSLLVDFIANNLGKDTPLHLSRYFPRYKLKTPPTPEKTLVRAMEICSQKLDYVYVGNMSAGDMENTYCPLCKSLLIERTGYMVNIKPLFKKAGKGASCGKCGVEILIQV
jgi:pyruvate formate lyase activating enzyme